MADKNPKEERKGVTPDEILERIVPDPANPDIKRLTGFLLGKSDRENYWRLYLTVDLNHFIEFRKEDTIHAQQFRPSRTVVWVKPDARITETKNESGTVDFLRGNMLSKFLGRRLGGFSSLVGSPMRLMEADGSGCAHMGCSVGCTPGYGCPGGGDTTGYTCGC